MASNYDLFSATLVTSRALPASSTLLGHKKAIASVHELGPIIVGIVTEGPKHDQAVDFEDDCRWLFMHLEQCRDKLVTSGSDIVLRLGQSDPAALPNRRRLMTTWSLLRGVVSPKAEVSVQG